MTLKPVLIILAVSVLAACSTTGGKPGAAAVEDRSAAVGRDGDTDTGDASARTYGAGTGSATSMTALDDPGSPLSVRIIYFEFDSSEIQSQFRETIEAHAVFLVANPGVVVALEGHADERGSREYNLALGERRSRTVKRQMTLLGVPSSQIRTTSYGEERPAVEGHDEFAWSQNRRVEIIY